MIAIQNGKLILPDGITEGKTLLTENGLITALAQSAPETATVLDARGRYVMPGLIDIHSDRIEQFIQPRPTAQMDFALALAECERELLLTGITTMYHSISLYQDEFFGKSPLRTQENVLRLAGQMDALRAREHLIRHRFHLRVEIDNLAAYDIARTMILEGKVHEISFMDHTPGQGQYRDMAVYLNTVRQYHGREISSLDADGVAAYHRNKRTLTFEQLRELSALAHQSGVAVASHDDDTPEKLALNREIGVDISEFPVTLETARAARAMGFATVVGAPNILMGGSHSGNLSATEAVSEGSADILCSDYYPASILHGVFKMARDHGAPLWEMVSRATLNPARAVRIDRQYGSIAVGKAADLLIVDAADGAPALTDVLVGGQHVAHVAYRR